MTISSAAVKKIAKLARIKANAEEIDFFSVELNKIMNWIEQLHEVNIDGITPLSSMELAAPTLRLDLVANDCTPADILKNAPNKYNCFIVPKVIE
jgi:aspartyl-tRNA(Asn)/glutamyl-tRNA(Gln) amidotransferase subunit C